MKVTIWKRMTSMFLVVAMMLSLVVTASAAEPEEAMLELLIPDTTVDVSNGASTIYLPVKVNSVQDNIIGSAAGIQISVYGADATNVKCEGYNYTDDGGPQRGDDFFSKNGTPLTNGNLVGWMSVSGVPFKKDDTLFYIKVTVDKDTVNTISGQEYEISISKQNESTPMIGDSSHHEITCNIKSAKLTVRGGMDVTPSVTASTDKASVQYGATTGLPTLTATVKDADNYEGLTYQWQKRNQGTTGWTDVTTATAAAWKFKETDIAEAGTFEYHCKVTNKYNGVDYTGESNVVTVTVLGTPITADMIQLVSTGTTAWQDVPYTGQPQGPGVIVKYGDKTLIENTDYTVSDIEKQIDAGTYKVTVTGKGGYMSSAEKEWKITPNELNVTQGSHPRVVSYDNGTLNINLYTADNTGIPFLSTDSAPGLLNVASAVTSGKVEPSVSYGRLTGAASKLDFRTTPNCVMVPQGITVSVAGESGSFDLTITDKNHKTKTVTVNFTLKSKEGVNLQVAEKVPGDDGYNSANYTYSVGMDVKVSDYLKDLKKIGGLSKPDTNGWSYTLDGVTTKNIDELKIKEAGDHTITVSYEDDIRQGSKNFTIKIKQKEISVDAAKIKWKLNNGDNFSIPYNGIKTEPVIDFNASATDGAFDNANIAFFDIDNIVYKTVKAEGAGSADGIAVGKYKTTATLKLKDEKNYALTGISGDVSKDWEIVKAKIEIDLNALKWPDQNYMVWNDTDWEPKLETNPNPGLADYTYTYNADHAGDYGALTGAPHEPGYYQAAVSFAPSDEDQDNYEISYKNGSETDSKLSWQFVIQKVSVDSPSVKSYTYDGYEHTAVDVRYDTPYKLDGTESDSNRNTATDAGDYTVYIGLKDPAHYEWASTVAPVTGEEHKGAVEISWSIAKAGQPTLVADDITFSQYSIDKDAKIVQITTNKVGKSGTVGFKNSNVPASITVSSIDKDTIELKPARTSDSDARIPTGTYSLTITLTGDNFEPAAETTINVIVIEKQIPTINVNGLGINVAYGDEASEIETKVESLLNSNEFKSANSELLTRGTVAYSITNYTDTTDAGTKGIIAKLTWTPNNENSANYGESEVNIPVNISKKPITVKTDPSSVSAAGKHLSDIQLIAEPTGEVTVQWDLIAEDPEITRGTSYAWTVVSTKGHPANYDITPASFVLWKSSNDGSSNGGTSGGSDPGVQPSNPGFESDDKYDPTDLDPGEHKNDDGSTTEVTENKDGSKTAVTKHEDGTVVTCTSKVTGNTKELNKTEERPDGTKTESQVTTVKNKDGSTTEKSTVTDTEADGSKTTIKKETETAADGASKTTGESSTGATGTVEIDKDGNVTKAEADVPAKAADTGKTVTLPISLEGSQNSNSAPELSIKADKPVNVEIPVDNLTPGTVAIIVDADGNEIVDPKSIVTKNGVALAIEGDVKVKLVDNSTSFNDMKTGHWAKDSVDYVSSRNLFNGTKQDTFSPDQAMTRQMLMTVLARVDGQDTSGDPYGKGMAWAVKNGVSDGSDPTGVISRQQLATMLYRYAGEPEISMNGSISKFSDSDTIADYAKKAMEWAVQVGILNGLGDGNIQPSSNATRAQVAAMIARFNTATF